MPLTYLMLMLSLQMMASASAPCSNSCATSRAAASGCCLAAHVVVDRRYCEHTEDGRRGARAVQEGEAQRVGLMGRNKPQLKRAMSW